MAGSSVEVLLSKRVQDMVLNHEEPLPPYISRHDSIDEHLVPIPPLAFPVINLTLLSSSQPEELAKLRSALSSWGCFQAIEHGIPKSFLDELRHVAKEFFQQTVEEKKKYAKGVEEFEGYGADPVPAQGQSLDWSDRLFLEVYPEHRRNPKLWPQNPLSFRQVLEDYTVKMKSLTEKVSKAMAKSLNLEENCFLDQFGERATLQARFNYYSCCQRPDLVLGLKAHADGSGYTIILQDDVEGLQVLRDNWVTVPTIPDALLILMGDQMEIMSNGIFKSPVHRVLTNSDRERISVAEIGPEAGLVDENRPRLFKHVKDYSDVHWEYYQQGKRALHVASV
ncbi:protein LATERAL BRANCHING OXIDOREDUCTASE 1-like [Euphorbia lathyris]|uniref:protein LATERAL BRANCHING OXIDOREDUCTASE 1-like n=1 Tax=Euphorbia lathyris TaxID=212925 RepID=UPI0033140C0A